MACVSDDIRLGLQPDCFDDWVGLHKLLLGCFSDMEGRIDPPSSLLRMTPESLRSKTQEELLIVGYCGLELMACGFFKVADDTVYLGKLAVKPEYRRRGVLKAIVQRAECTARDNGLQALRLETRIELVENHATFAALGFAKWGESAHDGYNRPTSIEMRKPL